MIVTRANLKFAFQTARVKLTRDRKATSARHPVTDLPGDIVVVVSWGGQGASWCYGLQINETSKYLLDGKPFDLAKGKVGVYYALGKNLESALDGAIRIVAKLTEAK